MSSRSDTPGSRGASIGIALILSVQTAIVTVENTIGFQPAPEIQGTICFIGLHNELDIAICVHGTSEFSAPLKRRINCEVSADHTMSGLLLNSQCHAGNDTRSSVIYCAIVVSCHIWIWNRRRSRRKSWAWCRDNRRN